MNSKQVHLLIFGGGSAAMSAAHRALDHGATVTVANAGLPMGGTCLNVGCVPSKYYIRAAESVHRAGHPHHPGLRSAGGIEIDWPVFVAGARSLVDELRRVNYEEPVPKTEGLRWIEGRAALEFDDTGAPLMVVNGERIAGDFALVATGANTFVPPIPGLADTPFITTEEIFTLPEQPGSMIVLGGGYIALECAQSFQRLGTRVTLLQRSARILKHEPEDLALELQDVLRSEGVNVVTDAGVESVRFDGDSKEFVVESAHGTLRAEQVFVGTGLRPNNEGLPEAILGEEGWVATDLFQGTALDKVYAAGDITGEAQFVYTASVEAEAAVDHMLTGTAEARNYDALPWVMFTDPQIAGVGMTLAEAQAAVIDADTAVLEVARWPRFRVSMESRGFLRLVRDRKTNCLVGARAICPEAGDLVSELALCIRQQIPVSEIVKVLHPYLTLSEGIERAALRFTEQP